MNHEEAQDLLAPYALGTLPRDERAALEAHLFSGCGDCRRALADLQAAALFLSLSAPAQEPPARVKARLMGRIGAGRGFAWARNLALAASVLVLAGLAGVWIQRRAADSWTAVSVTGEVRADGRPVKAGAAVRPGQLLAAAEGASADLRLGKGAVVRLMPGAEAAAVREGGGVLVRLQKGGLLSLVKTGDKFKVKTPVTAASVRGTVFYVQVDSPQKTYVCICRGRLGLETGRLSGTLTATHHHAVDVTLDGGGRMVPGTMRGHTDEDIASLRSRAPFSIPAIP